MSRYPEENKNESNDLEWLAFCYAANELSDLEAAEFELRLESDQAARDAVVNAVEQGQLIFAAIESSPTTIGNSNEHATILSPAKKSVNEESAGSSSRRASVLFATAAALLLMVGGWAWMNFETSAPIANDSENLADVWGDTLVARSQDFNSAESLILEDTELVATDASLDADSEDWMFVALTEMENSIGEFE